MNPCCFLWANPLFSLHLCLPDRWTGNGPTKEPTSRAKAVHLTIRRSGGDSRNECSSSLELIRRVGRVPDDPADRWTIGIPSRRHSRNRS